MSKRILSFVTAAVLLGASSLASAGSYYGIQSYVYRYTDGSGYASGSLQAVRGSSDNVQQIGCNVRVAGPNSWVECSAANSVGNTLFCYSSNPAMIAAAGAINETSSVGLYVSPYGECIDVVIYNGSVNLASH